MTQAIGIYGGTFDPVHHGHLILARDAVEQLGLSRLIFVPAAISPHKLVRAPGASAAHRLEMLQAATAGESIFEVDPCELHRPGPSFTVDTLLDFRARLPAGSALFYLIGEDNAATLHTWHRAAELSSLATFVVFRRSEPHDGTAADFPTLTRRVDISATELRNRVAAGRSIRYFVPQAVAALIEQARLYRSSDLTPPQETPLSPLNS